MWTSFELFLKAFSFSKEWNNISGTGEWENICEGFIRFLPSKHSFKTRRTENLKLMPLNGLKLLLLHFWKNVFTEEISWSPRKYFLIHQYQKYCFILWRMKKPLEITRKTFTKRFSHNFWLFSKKNSYRGKSYQKSVGNRFWITSIRNTFLFVGQRKNAFQTPVKGLMMASDQNLCFSHYEWILSGKKV